MLNLASDSVYRLEPSGWVDKYADIMFRYALSRIADPVVCEDLVQETFLSALKGMNNFKGKSNEQTWLIGILKHKILDFFRKKFKVEAVEVETENAQSGFPDFNKEGQWKGHWIPEHCPIEWENPESFFEKKQFWEIFENCLSRLKDNLKIVFGLYEMEDFSTEEICKELKITSTNLWVMLHRARKRLRKCLEINWIGDDKRTPDYLDLMDEEN